MRERQQAYVYDPSKQIQESFKSVTDGIDDAWKNVIDNKIKGFDMIKEARANQDAIKKNLNRFNREAITNMSNELQKKTANLIRKDGSINKEGLAEIGDEMEAMRNAEVQSKDAPQVVQEYLEMAQRNGTYINDVPGLYQKIMSAASDKELLFSSTGLNDKLKDIYGSSINMPLKLAETVKKGVIKGGKVPFNFTNKNGDRVSGTYTEVKGTRFNPDTMELEFTDMGDPNNPKATIADQIASVALSPEEKALWEKQMGARTSFAVGVDDDILENVKLSYLSEGNVTYKVEKTKAELDLAKLKEETAKVNLGIKEGEQAFQKTKQGLEVQRVNNNTKSLELRQQSLGISKANLDFNKEKYNNELKGIGTDSKKKTDSTIQTNSRGQLPLNVKVSDDEVYTKFSVQPDGSMVGYLQDIKNPVRISKDKMREIINNVSNVQDRSALHKYQNEGVAKSTPTQKSETNNVVKSKSGKTISQDAFNKMTPLQRINFKKN